MLDVEFAKEFAVTVKLSKGYQNVNDLVFICKSLSKSFSQQLFEKLCTRIQSQILDHFLGCAWQKSERFATPWQCPRCGNRDAFCRRGKRKRSLKSSIGRLYFYLLQVTCLDCGKTFSPFPALLGIGSKHRLTRELERALCSVIKDFSYQKTAKFFNLMLNLDLAPTTIHKVVQRKGQEVEIVENLEHITHLQTDSTRINASNNERGISVHMALSVGKSTQKGKRICRQKTLAAIQVSKSPEETKKLLNRSQIDQITVDGLSGLEGHINKEQLSINVQRCLWHIPRTTKHMLYLDGAATPWAKDFVKPMSGFMFNESLSVAKRLSKFNKIIEECRRLKYCQTVSFLENAKDNLFTYKQFAETDNYGRTNSIIERQMREINRRMENGSRWSEKGAENLLKLKFVEELNPESYDYLWKLRNHNKSTLCVALC